MGFPFQRCRRLRHHPAVRDLIRETHLNPQDLIMPLFVAEGISEPQPITSMPGCFRYPIKNLVQECRRLFNMGLKAAILFGIPKTKNTEGSGAWKKDGIIQKAVSEIKQTIPGFLVITDVCLCEYTSHGHCGVVKDGEIVNDDSLVLLANTALSHAAAGADVIAPSDMMDGRIAAIRTILDENGYSHLPVMAYSVKYASSFYGPFRDAAGSTPQFGDRKSYQMDSANRREAFREVFLDIDEGADIIMIKPALAYLDIISHIHDVINYPVAAFNVSGEFAMVKAAAANGWIDEKNIAIEILTSIKRAGADIIISYHAKDIFQWIF
ncbi:porphobilinogen synthase [bacterium]|nr:porphobilinogen synthase [candidate division CSSED10-310 bacterium]